ncbi:MAG: T9SS type A sorting domain-containing protein [bacterium]|nr:T9SS type A sorting domain-containing protein [bacterium]
MKKNGLTLVFIFVSFSLFSQAWIRKGAEWHYAYDALSSTGFTKFVYTKDTLVGGKTCQKITSKLYEFGANQNQQTYLKGIFPQADQYTYISGDTVFYWFETKFYVLYNIGAQPNDTWQLGNNPSSNQFGCTGSTIKVDSVGAKIINGKSYRWIAVSPASNSNVLLKGKIIERFGAMEFNLFPTQNVCNNSNADLPQSYFNCFGDDSFALYNTTGKDCEYLMKINVLKVGFNDSRIALYPNPAKSTLTIDQIEFKFSALELYSIEGRLVKSFALANAIEILEVAGMPNGLYTVKLISNKGEPSYKRVILE